MPRRLIDRGHPEDGAWGRWARFVLRRPVAVAAVGLAIVAVLAGLGTQLNPSEAQLKNFPGTGSAIAGRDARRRAGISPGVMKPLNVLVENGGDAAAGRGEAAQPCRGVVGATAPPDWQRGPNSLVEAFPAIDGAAPGIQAIIDRANASLEGNGRHADRHRRGRPRLPARPVRQLPVRARARPAPDADPAHAGVPLDRARDQGGRAEPRSRSPRPSGSSSSSSSRATARRSGTSPRRSRSRPRSR